MAGYPSSSTHKSPEIEKQNDKHRMLYKTPPNSKKDHRQKARDLMTTKRKERQAKLLETFRRMNEGSQETNNDQQKEKIIRETMSQMLKDMEADFPVEGFDEQQEYDNYVMTLQNELMNDYNELILQLNHDDEVIDADLNLQDSVPCFACQKSSMTFEHDEYHTKITCPACTFTFIRTELILSEQVNDNFARIMQQHGSNCRCIFQFEPIGDFHCCTNLKILCNNCNFNVFLF